MEQLRPIAKRAAVAAPLTFLAGIELLVRLGWQLPLQLNRAEIAALFPGFTPLEVARARRRAGWRVTKWRVLRLLARTRGAQAIDPYVAFAAGSPPSLPGQGGAIIGTWHAGIPDLVGFAAARFGPRVLGLRGVPPPFELPNVEQLVVGRRAEEGAMALKAAIDHLRTGGLVAVALDSPRPAETRACLGRALPFNRAVLAMARWSGAPLIPMIVCGSGPGPGIRVHLGPRIAVGEAGKPDDAAARWLEALLIANPGEMRKDLAQRLLGRAPDQAGEGLDSNASAASRRSSG